METHLSETNSSSPDPLLSKTQDPMPVPAETLDGSSPFPQSHAIDDHDLVHIPENANGPFSPTLLEALAGDSSDSSLPNSTASSPSLTPQSPVFEEGPEGEPSSPSPLNVISHDYDDLPNQESPSASSWSFRWSSTKESIVSSDSLLPVQETKPSMVGAGLANLGNTCFINAILQCFTHTVPLVEGLRSCDHHMPCDRGSEEFCVLCALRGHIDLSIASSGGVVSPFKLVNNLNHFSSYFRRYQQEDAHEFLQCFLDKLERSCLDSKRKDESSSSQDKNLVERVFGGRLISKLRCCNCGHCSDTYEPLIDLSLEIEDADTLPRALESFTKIEKINDLETKFTCENCKEEVSVEKQLVLDQVPPVAAFHLKRFKTDGSHVEKIEKHVDFPLELDLNPYTSSSDSNVELKYELYAIVEHIGFSSTSGHYFCFIRSSPDTWHRLDDSKVTRVREEFVLSQEAYILFYARKGTPWFSSLVESQKPCVDPAIMNTSPKSVLDNVESICNSYPSMNNADGCAANEPRDGERIPSASCGARREEVEVTDTRDTADGLPEHIYESRPEADGFKDTKDSTAMIDDSTPGGQSKCFDGTSHNNENICSTSSLGGNSRQQGFGEVRDYVFLPLTPPRAGTVDVFTFESPERIYHIPRNHVKSADNVSCKRKLINVEGDPMRKEACRYLSKSCPRSRRGQLLAAMIGPQSQGSLAKKRKGVGIF